MLDADQENPSLGVVDGSCEPGLGRKIIHIVMNAFYGFVEQRDDLDVRSKSVAGAAHLSGAWWLLPVTGPVTLGLTLPGLHLQSAEIPYPHIRAACFDIHKSASHSTRAIFADRSLLIEPLSLTAAYREVTKPGEDTFREAKRAAEPGKVR
jgi:nucleotidyltransferase/DNA polymerase involved in DNA repair